MPDVTPAGLFSLPLVRLQSLLANCAAFQTWTNTLNATDAAARVHLVEAALEGDNAVDFPCAVIWQGDDFGLQVIAGGARNHFADSGSLILWLEAEVPAEYESDPRNAQLHFMNDVGAILLDMMELAGSDDYLNIVGMDLTFGPAESDERKKQSLGQRMACEFEITWSRFGSGGGG